MVLVKIIKNSAYYKRYQTKFRRRREGKTDYFARRKLICQDKNKYGSLKYRLVVRFTNREVICQIVSAHICGDKVLSAAYSRELPRYGINFGLTNFAAAYATGLLLARRMLKKLKLDTKYEGVAEANGEDFNVERVGDEGPRPFKALLDVGLSRTSTGTRLFAAMKGVCDGGIYVPHNETRFVGYKEEALDANVLREYIFGGHVKNYMEKLKSENPEKFQKQFSRFLKNGIQAEHLENLYKEAHKKIRENPDAEKKQKKEQTDEQKKETKQYKRNKLSLKQRKYRVTKKKERLERLKAKK